MHVVSSQCLKTPFCPPRRLKGGYSSVSFHPELELQLQRILWKWWYMWRKTAPKRKQHIYLGDARKKKDLLLMLPIWRRRSSLRTHIHLFSGDVISRCLLETDATSAVTGSSQSRSGAEESSGRKIILLIPAPSVNKGSTDTSLDVSLRPFFFLPIATRGSLPGGEESGRGNRGHTRAYCTRCTRQGCCRQHEVNIIDCPESEIHVPPPPVLETEDPFAAADYRYPPPWHQREHPASPRDEKDVCRYVWDQDKAAFIRLLDSEYKSYRTVVHVWICTSQGMITTPAIFVAWHIILQNHAFTWER